jgi:hypothetical protein
MKKTLLLISLLVVLAAPAMAAPRNGDPGGRQGFIARIVRLIRALDDIVAGPPHP